MIITACKNRYYGMSERVAEAGSPGREYVMADKLPPADVEQQEEQLMMSWQQ